VKRVGALCACLTVLAATGEGCKDSAWTPMGSAELALSEIKLGGAATVSRRLDTDESFGRAVVNGIATGDSLWLEVAAKLTPPSAAAEASLSIALASALTRAPDKVLALVGEKYPLEEVCGIPFLRPESTFVVSYHAEAVAALERVRSSALSRTREACRAALDDARDERLARINPSYIVKNKPVLPPQRARRRPAKPRQVVTPQDTSSSK
jgi:hypothetical protein